MRFHIMHRYHYENKIDDLKKMSIILDAAGFYSVLLPYSADSVDYIPMVPDLIRSTKNIKFMIALRTYALSPEYAAKIFKTIKHNYGDRIIFNLVAGKFSQNEEDLVFKYYNGDISLIDTTFKRIQLSDLWSEKFKSIMQEDVPEFYTISNSEITMELANKHADYMIFDYHRLIENFNGAKDTSLVLIIDPLIRNSEEELNQEIEYIVQTNSKELDGPISEFRKQEHQIKGTLEQVKEQLLEISKKFKVNDFMVVTDQKDLTPIYRLVMELSGN